MREVRLYGFLLVMALAPSRPRAGEADTGRVAKVANDALASCNRLITYEPVAMRFKYGLSIRDTSKVINTSSAGTASL